ncbi:MAG: lipopolysaccharide kinase InaA family protein, partial [Burkholderiales bacterium]
NIKSLAHGIGRALRHTRAAASWRNAHRLCFYGIATAAPVALLERRIGPLRGVSYFISEYVEGPSCTEYFSNAQADQRDAVLENISRLLGTLVRLRISHGDLKAANVVIRNGEPVLLDLDSMREHASSRAFVRTWRRDYQRFMRNWTHDSALFTLFERRLSTLLAPQ